MMYQLTTGRKGTQFMMVQYFPEGGGVNADELRALTRRPCDIYFNW
jgi:hypothetical protein